MISFNLKGLGEFVYSICPFTADAKSIKILKSFYYWVYSIDVCQTDVLLAKEYDTPKEFIHLSIYICVYESGRFRLEQLTDRGYLFFFFIWFSLRNEAGCLCTELVYRYAMKIVGQTQQV
jgi:hypothetical protein